MLLQSAEPMGYTEDEQLCKGGIPIGSSKDGYFYAETAGEVYSTIRQLRDMQNGLEKAIKGLERGLDSFGFHEGGGSAW